jgi:hypothetical protein
MRAFVVIVTGVLTDSPTVSKVGPMPLERAEKEAERERWRNRPGREVRVEILQPVAA